MMYAAQTFIGVVAGAERLFNTGDQITDADAKEMGLSAKPELAAKTKEAVVAEPAKP